MEQEEPEPNGQPPTDRAVVVVVEKGQSMAEQGLSTEAAAQAQVDHLRCGELAGRGSLC